MDIKKLIAKFQKQGFAALTEEEKDLLAQNVSLMSKDLRAKFAEEVNAEADAEEEDKGEETTEEKGEEVDTNVDEKALKTLIQKQVKTTVDEMANKIAKNFVEGAKAQRARILAGEQKATDVDHEETRSFLKALVMRDHQKANTFNSDITDARGGYTVPPTLMAEILRILPAGYGIARRDMRYLPFSGPGNERKIPTLASSVTVSWVDESAKKGSSNPTFGLVTQTLKKLACIIPFSEEILEDSAINLTQLVAQLFAEAVAKEEDAQFFTGTGSPWTGILNNNEVNKVEFSGVPTTTDLTDALLSMIDKTPAGALAGAKFYMHRTMLSLIRKIKDDENRYIYQPATGTAPATLWGYPVELSEAFPKETDPRDGGFILFGNLQLAAILGDKQQIRAKVLDQATVTDGDGVTTLNLAEQDMIALRLEERVGYVLAVPSAVTVLVPAVIS